MTGRTRINGFSMIEAVAAVFVMSLTLLLASTVWVSVLNNYRSHDLSASSSNSARTGIEYMSSDLRSAKEVLTSYGTRSTSPSSVVVSSLSYDEAGVMPDTYDYISYEINEDSRLTRTVVSSGGTRVSEADRVLSDNVDALIFTYLCTEEFHGNGSATTFTLQHSWQANPTVIQNGTQLTGGYSLNPGTRAITFSSAPSSGSAIDVSYPINPADSDALADVSDVHINLRCEASEGDISRTITLETDARLRNKR